jgi:hypothetical protein
VAVVVVAAVASIALGVAAAAQAATVTVTEVTLDGWATSQAGTGATGFEVGPATPPAGLGSAELRVGADSPGDDLAEFGNSSHNGTALSAITRLDYWNFISQNAPGSCVAPYLTLNVDVDADGAFEPGAPDDVLNFEPCYQTGGYVTEPPGQTIPDQCPNEAGDPISPCFSDGVWNHWDALAGGWWSTFYGGAGGPPLTTIASYLQTLSALGHTQPRISDLRARVSAGPPIWNNFEGNVDALTIGVNGADTTYDFETFPNPVEGLSHNAFPVSGTVLVKEPGVSRAQAGGGFVPLTSPEQITDESIINAEKGKLKLVSAYNGHLQSVRLSTGKFRVRQKQGRRPFVNLILLGRFRGCELGGASSSAVATYSHRRRRRHRHLYGSGSGNYRTTANSGAATVSGTRWLTTDLCNGATLFVVKRGVVKIDDFGLPGRVNKILHAGQRYIAQP